MTDQSPTKRKCISLFLDCEFNGHYGELISVALHDRFEGYDFYEVSHDWEYWIKLGTLKEWVVSNVIPKLNKSGISPLQLQSKLITYLAQFEGAEITIYADWPEDFIHFCNLLFRPAFNEIPPSKIIPSIIMKIITTVDHHVSALPHNALEDAKALALNFEKQGYKDVPAN